MSLINNFSKSSTLLFLEKKIIDKNLVILPQIFFTKKYFRDNKNKILNKIIKKFKKKNIIIRSSALIEDRSKNSFAGKFKSYLNIKSNSKKISYYINQVLKDFKNQNDKIFIQEYIHKPKISGVIFTRELNTGSDYYVINYDFSKKTNLITSGKQNPSMKVAYIFKDSKFFTPKFKLLINIVKKIEKIYSINGFGALDLEFAIKDNKIYIFQCRILNVKNKANILSYSEVNLIAKKINKLKKPHPFQSGKTTILSNMADWNPAEMIGYKSKTFSTSLYKNLITNDTWSKQRSDYGYKDMRPYPLMVVLGCYNFIDLRTDFNSFLPKSLNRKISDKLINFFINIIKKKPYLHDKIEFNVVPTCFQTNLEKYLYKVLKKKEIDIYKKHLIQITENLIINKNTPLYKEISYLKLLDKESNNIIKSNLSEIHKIFLLTSICKKYGTLPFAGIARIAFICKKILNNLVDDKIISDNRKEKFLMSINTLVKIINKDFNKLKSKKITKENFLNKYGHLRPSTYSISVPSYKESFKSYFNLKSTNVYKIKNNNFFFTPKEKNKINKWFKKNNLNINFKDFLLSTKKSIFYREYSKLKFTKVIDMIFQEIIKFCKKFDIKRNDIEYLNFEILINAYNSLDTEELSNLIKKNIKNNKKLFKKSKKVLLPDIIISNKDCFFHTKDNIHGNYITNKNIIGNIRLLNFKLQTDNKNLKNKIVLIENADPGYDYLFSHNIKGLITIFGGPNSHMSIRCNELQIPAIIGIGHKNFNKIKDYNTISINCEKQKFELIN